MRENICVGIVAVGGGRLSWRNIGGSYGNLPSTIVLSRSYILPSLHLQGNILHRPKLPLAMNIMDLNKQEYGVVNKEEWLRISLE